MGIPEQVRRQADLANQLLNQENPEPENPTEPPVDPAELEDPPVEPPAEPDPKPEPQPSDPPATPAEPAPPAPDPWEQKYRTLQGVLNAESTRWQGRIKELESEIRQRDDHIATLKATPQPAPQPPAPAANDADVETYGPELVEVINRRAAAAADQIVAQRLAELKPELEKTQNAVTNVASQVNQTNEGRFYDALAKAVPDWQAVNADERWLSWLAEVDPLSGVPRQVYLDNASKQLDADRTAKLFNAFKDAAGISTPAPQPKPTPSPSPRTVGNASAPTVREPDTSVSTAEIQAHYRRGSIDRAYRNSPEHAAMEERIAAAMAAGAVRGA